MHATGTAGGSYFGYNDGCAYDPAAQRVFFSDPRFRYVYNFATNAWSSSYWNSEDWGKKRGVVDSKRSLVFFFGTRLNVWDIKNNTEVSSSWTLSELHDADVALDYDSKSDNIVAWTGGGPYMLDMTSKQWTRKNGTGAPASGLPNGTYGRWRYLADDNVFVLINGVDEDVHFYKHTAGGGTSLEKAFSKASQGPVLSVFPNPFSGRSVLKLRGVMLVAGGVDLAVFAPDGRLVRSCRVTDSGLKDGVRFDGAGLGAGIYLFRLQSGGRVVSARALLTE
jgi:hypothetical protein